MNIMKYLKIAGKTIGSGMMTAGVIWSVGVSFGIGFAQGEMIGDELNSHIFKH